MRLSALLLNVLVLLTAAFLSVVAARTTVSQVETRSVVAVQEDLIDNGYTWASVLGDGLQIVLEGQAPSEAERFRAIASAGTIVDASRVIDSLTVQETERLTAPEFAVEILRNDSGVSLIGLIPASTDRADLTDQITDIADGARVTDLLEVADYPEPESWEDALNYALSALEQLQKTKISVTSQRVRIDAITNSSDEKRTLETRLARNAPRNVTLAVQISAPRPVFAPFVTRFTLDDAGARFQVCAVDGDDANAKIIAAATELGFAGKSPCVEGLGVPTKTWGDAVAMAIRTVGKLGGGTVTIANTEVALVALEGTSQDLFDREVGELENALPDVFALSADLPVVPGDSASGPPQFTATLSPEGLVQIRGRVPDNVVNMTVENYAKARFGAGSITMGTRVVDGLPKDWVVRILAGIEALSQMSNGSVVVEPTTMTVRGNTGREGADASITRLLIDKLGEASELSIDVTYRKELDPIASLPSPEECIDNIIAVTEARKIGFDPGSADLTDATQPVIDEIADILRKCPDLRIQIAGYTDSQGREIMNQALSQDRAQAVLTALSERRIPVSSFRAVGFGEENPIADNSTEEGREANRRIEFSLIVPETTDETTTLEEIAASNAPDDAPEEQTDTPAEAEE